MAKKGQRHKKYSPEFKISVILNMRENHLSYRETARKYLCEEGKESIYKNIVKDWERIYLEEGESGFMVERRGRKSTGRPRKTPLDKEIENDLIAENQRLKEQLQDAQMEIEYLKKLDALIRAEEQKNNTRRK